MALFYLHRGSMGWGLKEFREIHVPKPPAFAPIHSFHGTTWPWSLSPCYSWKLLFVKNCIKSEKDKPKLERGYLQAISPTKDYASKYIKVYLPKETNWPNRNMDKRYEQTFTEEKDRSQKLIIGIFSEVSFPLKVSSEKGCLGFRVLQNDMNNYSTQCYYAPGSLF